MRRKLKLQIFVYVHRSQSRRRTYIFINSGSPHGIHASKCISIRSLYIATCRLNSELHISRYRIYRSLPVYLLDKQNYLQNWQDKLKKLNSNKCIEVTHFRKVCDLDKKLAAGLQIRVSGPYVYRPSIHAVTFQILWDILHAVTV